MLLRRRLDPARWWRLQTSGPEAGLQERASQPEIVAYYARVLDRLVRTGRVEFLPNSDFDGHRTVVSRISGERFEVPETCRIVNAHYLAPAIPAEVPPPFAVADGARVVPVNDLARLEEAPSQYVIVGSGKTATDAIVWLARSRRRPRRDLLGTPSRPVDAQPRPGAARPGDLLRAGRRHHAERRDVILARRGVPAAWRRRA